jgi:ferredoxin--NADP+ reductase
MVKESKEGRYECLECGSIVNRDHKYCPACGKKLDWPVISRRENRILLKKEIAPKIKLIEVHNPMIASRAKPGQFVILRLHERGKRFPLTISATSPEEGNIRLIFNEVGAATKQLGKLNVGDRILNMPGPLGNPTEIKKFGTVLCIGGGVMIGPLLWEVSAFKEAGNYVITVIGARTKELLFFMDEFKTISDEFYVATDDGSYGYKGLDFLKEIIEEKKIDRVYATSVATATLREICNITKPYGIKTIVSLTPIMVDGSGMCGACRVIVKGKMRFACVDGPEFDGHEVDWDVLEQRKRMYSAEERILLLSHGIITN